MGSSGRGGPAAGRAQAFATVCPPLQTMELIEEVVYPHAPSLANRRETHGRCWDVHEAAGTHPAKQLSFRYARRSHAYTPRTTPVGISNRRCAGAVTG